MLCSPWNLMKGPSCCHTTTCTRPLRPLICHRQRQESQQILFASHTELSLLTPLAQEEGVPVWRLQVLHTKFEHFLCARRRWLTGMYPPTLLYATISTPSMTQQTAILITNGNSLVVLLTLDTRVESFEWPCMVQMYPVTVLVIFCVFCVFCVFISICIFCVFCVFWIYILVCPYCSPWRPRRHLQIRKLVCSSWRGGGWDSF